MRLKFVDLHSDELWALRQEVVVNSLFTADYENIFGFAPKSMQDFFDGYVEYLEELAKDEGGEWNDYDDEGNLFDYYWNCDDYSWVEYDPAWTEEEEKEYEEYWNGKDSD